LKVIIADKNYVFRSFRIGKELYAEKFKYDLATDFTPAEIYKKALTDKNVYQQKMTNLANVLWQKYYGGQAKPKENIQLVQMVMDKIQLQHATPKDFFDLLTSQVYRLKEFIIKKNLIRARYSRNANNSEADARVCPRFCCGQCRIYSSLPKAGKHVL
jgi:hypothetical protein